MSDKKNVVLTDAWNTGHPGGVISVAQMSAVESVDRVSKISGGGSTIREGKGAMRLLPLTSALAEMIRNLKV